MSDRCENCGHPWYEHITPLCPNPRWPISDRTVTNPVRSLLQSNLDLKAEVEQLRGLLVQCLQNFGNIRTREQAALVADLRRRIEVELRGEDA